MELNAASLDRYITGNWGEDQFAAEEEAERWRQSHRCPTCGCYLPLTIVAQRSLTKTYECKGPNAYGEPYAGWVYTPCETDCTGPHTFEEYDGVESDYQCSYCGTICTESDF